MGKLNHCRKKIDEIDRNIAKLFLLRFNIVKEIAHHKKTNKIKITDRKRELDILKNVIKYPNNHKNFWHTFSKKL